MRRVFVAVLSLFCMLNPNPVCAGELERKIHTITEEIDAKVGVAVIIDGKDTVAVNNSDRYPLMSVFKFHQALAVADLMGRTGATLDDTLFVTKEMLKQNTYSPLRDRWPDGGVSLTLRELMDYTLQMSDNNACDILFDYVGGPNAVDAYLRKVMSGEECDFAISATENDMHRDLSLCYNNWSSPVAAASLLDRFVRGDMLRYDLQEYIREAMISCGTGLDRLVAPLRGKDAVIGHKTGTGDRNETGRIIAINDIGFVSLPDGRGYTIAVFVKDIAGYAAEASRLIAEISDAVYRHVMTLAE